MKIDVVGGGPAGSRTAYLLARKGHEVDLYERNSRVGPPVQCTGILSDYFTTIMKPRSEFVENTVTRTRIYAPDGNFVDTRIKKNYVVCRKKFDSYLAKKAVDEGARLHLNTSFRSFKDRLNGTGSIDTYGSAGENERLEVLYNSKGRSVKSCPDKLIGADGPLSPVAKQAGLYTDRNHIIGTQIEVKMDNDNVVDFYPYMGCYAWIVPKNEEVVRIGVAAYKNTMGIFKRFVRDKLGRDYEKKTIENQSGVIPIFNPGVSAQTGSVYLNGDAASFVKATTGGGINQSLKAAGVLADALHEGKDYDKMWHRSIYRNLHTHLIVHKMMQKFTDSDWNKLVSVFSKKEMKDLLYAKSRDRIVSMVASAGLRNPQLLSYARFFPREEFWNLFA